MATGSACTVATRGHFSNRRTDGMIHFDTAVYTPDDDGDKQQRDGQKKKPCVTERLFPRVVCVVREGGSTPGKDRCSWCRAVTWRAGSVVDYLALALELPVGW